MIRMTGILKVKRKFYINTLVFIMAVSTLAGCSGSGEEIETSGTESGIETHNTSEPSDTSLTYENPLITENTDFERELISIYPYAEVNPDYKQVSVNGNTVNNNPAAHYRGIGAVISENSARLLMDYKEDDYGSYYEILENLFKPDTGAGISHIKIEFKSDTNLPWGTLPASIDVYKNAGFMVAADAKMINPEITVEIYQSREPYRITDAFKESTESGYEARYKWYKETIEAIYGEYGLVIDYIHVDFGNTSDTIQESDIDISLGVDWVVYLSGKLKSENESPYDFNEIKIIVSDNNESLLLSKKMLENAEFRNSVAVIGVYGTNKSGNEILELNEKYGKEIWHSQGIAPNKTYLSSGSTGANTGLSGAGSALDICNSIINGYYNEKMTMYEYTSAIASFYTNAENFPNSLITAQTPWNGNFQLNTGIWTSLHFTGFIEKGWKFIDSACFGGGTEDLSITETTNNYLTTTNPETGDFSIVICNDSDKEQGYTFTLTNLEKADKLLHVWETAEPREASEEYNFNYMQLVDEFFAVEQLSESNNNYDAEIDENGIVINSDESSGLPPHMFSVTLKPYSIMTITTLDKYGDIIDVRDYDFTYTAAEDDGYLEVLSLPWNEEYEYDEEFLKTRGNTPMYVLDQGGVFEVAAMFNEDEDEDEDENENNVLMQTLTQKNFDTLNPDTTAPITCFGDDRWANYGMGVDFLFDKNGAAQNYVQFGIRYIDAESGYAFRIFQDGNWQLKKNSDIMVSGKLNLFDALIWHNVKITANQNIINVYLDNTLLAEYTDVNSVINSGRISIASDYFNNCFDNVIVEELENMNPYVVRVDDHNPLIVYTGEWDRNIVSENAFTQTFSESSTIGAEIDFWFYGSEISFIGKSENAVLNILIDGEEFEIKSNNQDSRTILYELSGLAEASHIITIELLSGSISLNMIEYS